MMTQVVMELDWSQGDERTTVQHAKDLLEE